MRDGIGKLPPTCPECELWSLPPAHQPPLLASTVEFVVASCSGQLQWLPRTIEQTMKGLATTTATPHELIPQRITVYSKCVRAAELPQPADLPHSQRGLLQLVRTRVVPNVGRNDQTYAVHLASFYNNLSDLIFCLKDTSYSSPYRQLRKIMVPPATMATHAIRAGFACGRTPHAIGKDPSTGAGSLWHVRHELWQFRLRKYNSAGVVGALSYRAGGFVPANESLPEFLSGILTKRAYTTLRTQALLPVCYGGTFALIRERAHSHPQATWWRAAAALSVADDLEAGHYMERRVDGIPTRAACLAQSLYRAGTAPRVSARMAAAVTFIHWWMCPSPWMKAAGLPLSDV